MYPSGDIFTVWIFVPRGPSITPTPSLSVPSIVYFAIVWADGSTLSISSMILLADVIISLARAICWALTPFSL